MAPIIIRTNLISKHALLTGISIGFIKSAICNIIDALVKYRNQFQLI